MPKNPTLNSFDATLAAVRELAWTGQHGQAIELTTQALSAPKLKPAALMDLLDLRAESYGAQGQLDLAGQDAARMVKLAQGAKAGAAEGPGVEPAGAGTDAAGRAGPRHQDGDGSLENCQTQPAQAFGGRQPVPTGRSPSPGPAQ